MVNYRGWSDPVGKLEAFRVVIKHLVSRTDNFRVRIEKATLPLVGMRPEDFPKRIRGRAEKVLAVRSAVAVEYVNDTLWHFERLTPKQRKTLIDDLLRLYESLLIDLGRMGKDYDFVTQRIGEEHVARMRQQNACGAAGLALFLANPTKFLG